MKPYNGLTRLGKIRRICAVAIEALKVYDLKVAKLLLLLMVLLSSCTGDLIDPEMPIEPESPAEYNYQLGLGYGFLGKQIKVLIDGNEVISLVGTEEIETFAQMQGTNMLVSGFSPDQKIMVNLIVDQDQPIQQEIDLKSGRYIHIYLEKSGYQIYNTDILILE